MSFLKVSLIVSLGLVVLCSAAHAQDTYWTDAYDDWSTDALWTAGEPTVLVDAHVDNGGTAVVYDPDEVCRSLEISLGSQVSVMIGGLLAVDGELKLWDGLLDIDGGSVTNTHGTVGYQSGSSGTVNVAGPGGTWVNSRDLRVGYWGTGALNITGGGSATSTGGYVGHLSGSSGTVSVDGAGSTWTNSDHLYVGDSETGTLNITGGGSVTNNYGYLGHYIGSVGTVSVAGAGSIWTNIGTLYVGERGTGTLNITGGGSVTSPYADVGFRSSSSGTVNVDGAGSTWTNNGHLNLGFQATGTLNITNGGSVTNAYGTVGYLTGASGTVSVDGAGSTWTNNGSLRMGMGYQGTSTLSITGGGTVTNTSSGTVGCGSGSNATVSVDGAGSSWTNSTSLHVGSSGTGALDITDGGSVTSTYGHVGFASGSSGTVSIDGAGSSWTNTDLLYVGFSGTGALSITAGGAMTNTASVCVGYSSSSSGTVSVDGAGSTWTTSGSLYIGGYSSGAGGAAEVTVAGGGLLHVADTLYLWNASTLTIDGATVQAGYLANAGQLNATGLLDLGGWNSTGTVNLTGDATIYGDGSIGAGAVFVAGGATVSFADALIHNGSTFNVSGNTVVTFYGDVSGDGSFVGDGSVHFAGSYSPGNSPGNVTLNNVAYLATNELIMELGGVLGSEYDHITVTGSASLDGLLKVVTLDDFMPSLGDTFDLFDWNGTRSGQFSSSILPTLADANWSWDTSAIYATGNISVVPEPATMSLLATGGCAALLRRRRN